MSPVNSARFGATTIANKNMDKPYITIRGKPIKLNVFDAKIEAAIESDIDAGNILFELKRPYWSGATNLPNNVKAIYVSGSHPNVPVPGYDGLAVAGEVAVFREQGGQQKAYRYLLVQSGSGNFYYADQFKKFPDHYYSGSHPTGSIWHRPHPPWR